MTGSREDYRFDDVTVEPAAFRVLRGGVPARIEPKALELLIHLIERRDRVVPKQELLDEVWKGTVVTENALTRVIAQIRKVLGDDPDHPRYIQTVPTRGYRFIGELIETAEPQPPIEPAQTHAEDRRKRGASFLLLVGVLVPVLVIASMAAFVSVLHVMRGIRAPEPERKMPFAARPLAPSERVQSFPSFSPDGNAIAYSSDVDGTPHIFTMAVAGGEAVQVTKGDGESQPSWSPDGKTIAYVSVRHGGIWSVPAGGGNAVQLTATGSCPAWSPDGSEIAFQTGDSIAYGWTAFDAQPFSTIAILGVNTHRISPLTRAGQPAGGHATPAWRADGKRLAFSSCDLEHCGIYTIARDGSGLAEILTDSVKLSSPVFARDGRAVDCVVVHYNSSVLQSLPVDRDGNRTAGAVSRIRESNPGVIQHVAISRDGFRLAWSLSEERSDLVVAALNANGTAPAQPLRVTHDPTMRHAFPAFSPDGTKIAYCAFGAGPDGGVWISDADGRNAKAVAVGPGLKQHTGWSRRGWDIFYSIWFRSVQYGQGPAIFRSSLISGRSSLVTALPHGSSAPVLSPDETRVAFNRTINGITSVWVCAINGEGMRQLTPDSALARYPIWSPSGKRIAVQVRLPDGTSAVGVIASGGGPLHLLTKGGDSWPYSWSPDETRIAFAGRRDGVWNVWTVALAGGERRVTDNQSATIWLRSPVWSPSGDRILFEMDEPKENVWVSEPAVVQ